jgi:hypothetical protein
MGTPITKNDIPELVDKYIHFASPKFWCEKPCINGQVRYVDASTKGKVVYVKPYGVDYLVRVDITLYEVVERIEEHEQHSSH